MQRGSSPCFRRPIARRTTSPLSSTVAGSICGVRSAISAIYSYAGRPRASQLLRSPTRRKRSRCSVCGQVRYFIGRATTCSRRSARGRVKADPTIGQRSATLILPLPLLISEAIASHYRSKGGNGLTACFWSSRRPSAAISSRPSPSRSSTACGPSTLPAITNASLFTLVVRNSRSAAICPLPTVTARFRLITCHVWSRGLTGRPSEKVPSRLLLNGIGQ